MALIESTIEAAGSAGAGASRRRGCRSGVRQGGRVRRRLRRRPISDAAPAEASDPLQPDAAAGGAPNAPELRGCDVPRGRHLHALLPSSTCSSIGALLSAAAVGQFSAVYRILLVLGYLGLAVSGGVAPGCRWPAGRRIPSRSTRRSGICSSPRASRSRRCWSGRSRSLSCCWARATAARPSSAQILTVVAFVSAPAALISVSVTYMGEGRRRVAVVLGTLVLGLVSIYSLIEALGLVGAAIGDDIVVVVYVAGHLWICARLIDVDLRSLARSCLRTLLAAAVMALPLLVIGVDHLTAWEWVAGLADRGTGLPGGSDDHPRAFAPMSYGPPRPRSDRRLARAAR